MKTFILTFFMFVLMVSCNNEIDHEESNTTESINNNQEEGRYVYNNIDKSGNKQGKWRIWGIDFPEKGYPEQGVIEEGSYVDDKKSGLWKYNLTDGKTVEYEKNYSDGLLNGESKYYDYGNEIIVVEVYQNDLMISSESIPLMDNTGCKNMKDDNELKAGYWCVWGVDWPYKGYPDAQIIEEGQYELGEREGMWIFYNKDGSIGSETTFSKNRITNLVLYDYENEVIITQEREEWKVISSDTIEM